ncbi:uncharacterized protein MCYG_06657 [Microsporum canis CBS 113480]|uniref:Uncharacterized protein n=1 Tax=Arthroderma otae (strain ATCC MYA-4605 / CBS 113480) TaxID=554155 RepID=C5FVA4_ARTOC|nr:uncharacterized protein MCYG_06657 [Microsporum canis CBS 113480]EEQ33838.1 predicted protein [Microsporum canis CBS 113480]
MKPSWKRKKLRGRDSLGTGPNGGCNSLLGSKYNIPTTIPEAVQLLLNKEGEKLVEVALCGWKDYLRCSKDAAEAEEEEREKRTEEEEEKEARKGRRKKRQEGQTVGRPAGTVIGLLYWGTTSISRRGLYVISFKYQQMESLSGPLSLLEFFSVDSVLHGLQDDWV